MKPTHAHAPNSHTLTKPAQCIDSSAAAPSTPIIRTKNQQNMVYRSSGCEPRAKASFIRANQVFRQRLDHPSTHTHTIAISECNNFCLSLLLSRPMNNTHLFCCFHFYPIYISPPFLSTGKWFYPFFRTETQTRRIFSALFFSCILLHSSTILPVWVFFRLSLSGKKSTIRLYYFSYSSLHSIPPRFDHSNREVWPVIVAITLAHCHTPFVFFIIRLPLYFATTTTKYSIRFVVVDGHWRMLFVAILAGLSLLTLVTFYSRNKKSFAFLSELTTLLSTLPFSHHTLSLLSLSLSVASILLFYLLY